MKINENEALKELCIYSDENEYMLSFGKMKDGTIYLTAPNDKKENIIIDKIKKSEKGSFQTIEEIEMNAEKLKVNYHIIDYSGYGEKE